MGNGLIHLYNHKGLVSAHTFRHPATVNAGKSSAVSCELRDGHLLPLQTEHKLPEASFVDRRLMFEL